MRRRGLAATAALALLAAGATAALGVMSGSTQGSQTVTTGTLQPPTAPGSQHPNATGAAAGQVNLSWTASTSTFVAGHRVLRASAPGGPYGTLATLGAAASSYSDATAPYNGESYYKVQAFRNAWTADSAVQASHSLPAASGTDRVTGAGAGTALTGPWTSAGTQLAALSVADGVRYQPTTWPASPTFVAGVSYLDTSHAWASGSAGTMSSYNGTTWSGQASGTTQDLVQVQFVDASSGWAVGGAGTIRSTTNGGTTWSGQTSGTTQNLWDIDCVSASQCVAVGDAGTILKTTNGGGTWTAQASGTTQPLWAVDCVSAATCWVSGAGGTILKTTNGGTSWAAQPSGAGAAVLYGMSCVSTSQCWTTGSNGLILTTANGGTSWSAQTSGTTQILGRLQMLSATVGYIAGTGGQVLKTTNGGATWSSLTVPNADYYGVSCADVSHCIIVSASGSMLMTADGGASWNEGAAGYVQLAPLIPTLAPGETIASVLARVVFRTTAVPGAGSRFLLMASADAGATWSTFSLTAPTAANTDVTQSVDLTPLGFSPAARAQTILLRFAVVPRGGAITTQLDLVHVDVN